VLTPTMPAYFGIKDSHRNGRLTVEPDDAVNAFLDEALSLGGELKNSDGRHAPPGLLDGDTAVGNCVTSAWFQGFKVDQKERLQNALRVIPQVSKLFEARFGRPGISLFERHGMEDSPEVALVCMGPDAGTMIQLLPQLREELGVRVGLIVLRVLTPFPAEALAQALSGVQAVGVVNHAHHHGRGHLTLDVSDALSVHGRTVPIESFFCGLGGADVSPETWRRMTRITADAATRGAPSRRWHLLHDGLELTEES
jgi:pyruvate ferredoxin oxidoreductase alpha subunit